MQTPPETRRPAHEQMPQAERQGQRAFRSMSKTSEGGEKEEGVEVLEEVEVYMIGLCL